MRTDSNDKVTVQKTFTKNFSNTQSITATLKLHSLSGQKAYFSITAVISGNGPCGCIHDEIAKHFPDLACWFPMHLSDVDGIPMHSYENALYNAGFYADEFRDAEAKPLVLANHLRISVEQAEKLCYKPHDMSTNTMPQQKDDMRAFVESQKGRWKVEADSFINFLAGV